jgi:hypothetical protein
MGKDKDQKQLDKLTETPEEKKRRRQEKKEKKEAKRAKNDDLMGYTNESNPFGDSNLTEKFVWKLKKEKEEKLGIKDKHDENRKDEIRQEIAKVKKRREERELEKAQWEEEKARMQREADAGSYKDWESKEDEFYLRQAKMAAEIRIKQGRAKPIDILYKNLSMDTDFDFEMNEPYQIFKGLDLLELEELKKDIKMYLELDTHKDFWQALTTVCDDELETARKHDAVMKAKSKSDMMRFAGNTGMHEAITDDVHELFKGKTSKELDELQATITLQIESGAAMDVEYWETLLKKLAVFRAKAKLKEIHADMLRKKLAELESMQAQQSMGSETASPPTTTTTTSTAKPAEKPAEKKEPAKKPAPPKSEWEEDERKEKKGKEKEGDRKGKEKEEERKGKEREKVEEKGGLSPVLIHTVYEGEEVVEPEKDMEVLSNHRKQVLTSEAKKLLIRMDARDRRDTRLMTEDEMYRQEADRGMEESEEMLGFDMELPVENKVYSLHDKFRPRKPKFFNRVHTGYEWNKYNQTHYDHDNPPPKVVQGYKFNIFYPDLLDKTQAPTYKVLPGPTPDTCTLLIHAGPPYEDVAFKIVNREWEYSHKKGFRCTFERGILHLWFNFKRYRYRR